MEATWMVQFCSRGTFRPSCEGTDSVFENTAWSNQFGSGRDLTLNLVWFRFTFEVYQKHKKLNGEEPLTVPYEGIPTEEVFDERK